MGRADQKLADYTAKIVVNPDDRNPSLYLCQIRIVDR